MKLKPVTARAKLVRRELLAKNVYEFSFEMIDPLELHFLAGQYVSVKVNSKTRRSYSISTSPLESKRLFKLILNVSPDGIGTNYFMSLKKYDEISFIGQIGNFILPEKLSKKLMFIGTGVGISPLKSMIETLILSNAYKSHKIILYWGTRKKSDIFYEEIFDNYLRENKILEYKIFLSRESSVMYEGGYVLKAINEKSKKDLSDTDFFMCGSGQMIKSVEKILFEKSVPKELMHYEGFY